MKILYDPGLLEDVILFEVKRREEEGELSLFNEYHGLADSIYEEFPVEEREAEFAKLHEGYFLKLGFAENLIKALSEFPGLEAKISEVIVGRAIAEHEEGADLSRDLKRIGIKIRPSRFLDPPFLQRYLRHELTHVLDMLDKEFGYRYEERLARNPIEENIIRIRYKTLWDISIDSRLIRGGKETVSDREGRYREFEAFYQNAPSHIRMAVFEDLWSAERLTHGEILEMARNPRKLFERGMEVKNGELPEGEIKIMVPGSPCPLCHFTTYRWAEDPQSLEGEVIEMIKKDFPGWRPEDGACEQCIELYKVRAGCW